MFQNDKALIEKLNELISKNLEKSNYSVEDICLELGISRSQLFRLVKEQTNLSPSRLIRQHRLLKGKELLETTNLRIVEIASQVGFDSQQTFSKFFTEDFGVNPTEYRKNRLQGVEAPASKQEEHITQSPELQPIGIKTQKTFVSQKYKYMGFAFLAIVVLVAGFYLWQHFKPVGETTGSESDHSIAVLPFKSTDSPEAMLLAEGVMEQVHVSLTTLENLKVISKNSSQLFKDSKKTIPQIASQLHVAYVLDGTATQIGERISVSIELVKASEDQVIWTQHYEGEASKAIAFINKIAKEIANQLQKKLAKPFATQSVQIPTNNLEAYNEYLQGRQLLSTRTKEKLQVSLEKFDKAIALDPNFADAYACKASAYFSLGNLNHIDLDSSFRMAERDALKAIQLDAANAQAYGLLAAIYRDQYKWEQANTTFQIALRCNPNDAQVNYWYSLMLRSVGLLDEAVKYSTKAVSLDPLYPVILAGHIRNCSYANKMEMTKEAIKKGELLFNDSFLFYWSTAYHYLYISDYPKALRELTKAQQLNPNQKGIAAAMAYTQACLGQYPAVKTYLATLPDTPDNYTYFAMVYAGLKDKENCLNYLEQMAASGKMPTDMKVSPFFKFLHSDKRFNQILQQFGLLNFKLPT